jgi:acetate kinase
VNIAVDMLICTITALMKTVNVLPANGVAMMTRCGSIMAALVVLAMKRQQWPPL